MQTKFILTNSNSVYDPNRIYKVNEITSHLGYDYQNTTGRNTVPGVDVNWKFIPKITNEVGFIDYPRLTAPQQDFEITEGKIAKQVFINDAIQHPLSVNNATEINTFTQTGTTVTLTQTTEENNYISIYF